MLPPKQLVSLKDVLELKAERFSKALISLVELRMLLSRISALDNEARIDWSGVKAQFDGLWSELQAMDAMITAKAVQRLEMSLRQAEAGELAHVVSFKLHEIQERFLDEMSLVKLFVVHRDTADAFDASGSFLDELSQEKFPDIIYDCDEAGKALALSRDTASVFHLMRATEAVAATLAASLGATVKNKHGETLPWGVLTSNIKDKIDGMVSGEPKDRWLGVHMFLVGCNRAFRTKTAHPAAKYTPEEAKDAYGAVRSFIKSVAKLL